MSDMASAIFFASASSCLARTSTRSSSAGVMVGGGVLADWDPEAGGVGVVMSECGGVGIGIDQSARCWSR